MRQFFKLIPFFVLVSCGVPNGVGGEMALSHKDFEANFNGFASACFAPVAQTDKVFCSKIATFAHYTLTFTQKLDIDGNTFKVQFKKRLYEKAGSSCISGEIKPDSIRVFKSQNKKATISDEDIETHDQSIFAIIAKDLEGQNQKSDENCYHLTLMDGGSPLMQYKIRLESTVPVKDLNAKPNVEYIGFFSAGSPIYFE